MKTLKIFFSQRNTLPFLFIEGNDTFINLTFPLECARNPTYAIECGMTTIYSQRTLRKYPMLVKMPSICRV